MITDEIVSTALLNCLSISSNANTASMSMQIDRTILTGDGDPFNIHSYIHDSETLQTECINSLSSVRDISAYWVSKVNKVMAMVFDSDSPDTLISVSVRIYLSEKGKTADLYKRTVSFQYK